MQYTHDLSVILNDLLTKGEKLDFSKAKSIEHVALIIREQLRDNESQRGIRWNNSEPDNKSTN